MNPKEIKMKKPKKIIKSFKKFKGGGLHVEFAREPKTKEDLKQLEEEFNEIELTK